MEIVQYQTCSHCPLFYPTSSPGLFAPADEHKDLRNWLEGKKESDMRSAAKDSFGFVGHMNSLVKAELAHK